MNTASTGSGQSSSMPRLPPYHSHSVVSSGQGGIQDRIRTTGSNHRPASAGGTQRSALTGITTRDAFVSSRETYASPAQLERMSELHSQREKSLMKTITQLKEKVQTLENQKQEDSSRRSIQKLSKDLRHQEQVTATLRSALLSMTDLGPDQVNDMVLRKTLGGPTRFGQKTKEQLQTEVNKLKRKLYNSRQHVRSLKEKNAELSDALRGKLTESANAETNRTLYRDDTLRESDDDGEFDDENDKQNTLHRSDSQSSHFNRSALFSGINPETEIDELSATITEKDQWISQQRRSVETLEDRVSELRKEVWELRLTNQDLETQLSGEKDLKERAQTKLHDAHVELSKTRTDLEYYQSTVSALKGKLRSGQENGKKSFADKRTRSLTELYKKLTTIRALTIRIDKEPVVQQTVVPTVFHESVAVLPKHRHSAASVSRELATTRGVAEDRIIVNEESVPPVRRQQLVPRIQMDCGVVKDLVEQQEVANDDQIMQARREVRRLMAANKELQEKVDEQAEDIKQQFISMDKYSRELKEELTTRLQVIREGTSGLKSSLKLLHDLRAELGDMQHDMTRGLKAMELWFRKAFEGLQSQQGSRSSSSKSQSVALLDRGWKLEGILQFLREFHGQRIRYLEYIANIEDRTQWLDKLLSSEESQYRNSQVADGLWRLSDSLENAVRFGRECEKALSSRLVGLANRELLMKHYFEQFYEPARQWERIGRQYHEQIKIIADAYDIAETAPQEQRYQLQKQVLLTVRDNAYFVDLGPDLKHVWNDVVSAVDGHLNENSHEAVAANGMINRSTTGSSAAHCVEENGGAPRTQEIRLNQLFSPP